METERKSFHRRTLSGGHWNKKIEKFVLFDTMEPNACLCLFCFHRVSDDKFEKHLTTHLLQDNDKLKIPLSCNECFVFFNRFTDIATHIPCFRQEAARNKSFMCNVCSYKCVSFCQLNRHNGWCHKLLTCSICKVQSTGYVGQRMHTMFSCSRSSKFLLPNDTQNISGSAKTQPLLNMTPKLEPEDSIILKKVFTNDVEVTNNFETKANKSKDIQQLDGHKNRRKSHSITLMEINSKTNSGANGGDTSRQDGILKETKVEKLSNEASLVAKFEKQSVSSNDSTVAHSKSSKTNQISSNFSVYPLKSQCSISSTSISASHQSQPQAIKQSSSSSKSADEEEPPAKNIRQNTSPNKPEKQFTVAYSEISKTNQHNNSSSVSNPRSQNDSSKTQSQTVQQSSSSFSSNEDLPLKTAQQNCFWNNSMNSVATNDKNVKLNQFTNDSPMNTSDRQKAASTNHWHQNPTSLIKPQPQRIDQKSSSSTSSTESSDEEPPSKIRKQTSSLNNVFCLNVDNPLGKDSLPSSFNSRQLERSCKPCKKNKKSSSSSSDSSDEALHTNETKRNVSTKKVINLPVDKNKKLPKLGQGKSISNLNDLRKENSNSVRSHTPFQRNDYSNPRHPSRVVDSSSNSSSTSSSSNDNDGEKRAQYFKKSSSDSSKQSATDRYSNSSVYIASNCENQYANYPGSSKKFALPSNVLDKKNRTEKRSSSNVEFLCSFCGLRSDYKCNIKVHLQLVHRVQFDMVKEYYTEQSKAQLNFYNSSESIKNAYCDKSTMTTDLQISTKPTCCSSCTLKNKRIKKLEELLKKFVKATVNMENLLAENDETIH